MVLGWLEPTAIWGTQHCDGELIVETGNGKHIWVVTELYIAIAL